MTARPPHRRAEGRTGPGFRVRATARGATISQGDAVLSRIVDRPGPTHGFFDLIAATISALHDGGSLLVLGFAGGGIVAPLRAMGVDQPIEAIDLSLAGQRVFRRFSADWCGDVRVHRGDAVEWLTTTRRRFDLILEDLSIAESGIVVKPGISSTVLPGLISRRLRPGGTAVFNLLETPRTTWAGQVEAIRKYFAETLTVRDHVYENRLVVAAASLPTARSLSLRLRLLLESIGSQRADGARVRS